MHVSLSCAKQPIVIHVILFDQPLLEKHHDHQEWVTKVHQKTGRGERVSGENLGRGKKQNQEKVNTVDSTAQGGITCKKTQLMTAIRTGDLLRGRQLISCPVGQARATTIFAVRRAGYRCLGGAACSVRVGSGGQVNELCGQHSRERNTLVLPIRYGKK